MERRDGKQLRQVITVSPPVVLGALAVCTGVASIMLAPTMAAPRSKGSASRSQKILKPTLPQPVTKKVVKPLPRYLPLKTINTLRNLRGEPVAGINGGAGTANIAPPVNDKDLLLHTVSMVETKNKTRQRFAQALPLPPAGVNTGRTPARAPVTPRWVRYPLEFQMCGIGLGTRAVDKDRFNRIDRYGLFAMHGNPTAVLVPVFIEGGGGGSGGSGGGSGGSGGGGEAQELVLSGLTIQQRPPLAGAALFPATQNGHLAHWASAVAVRLDNNHVQWLYNRGTYAMGFVVDRLGFVDAIVVAGIQSPIARTQLEDPVHTVKLGDDLRKVLNRYGYPDTIETYIVASGAASISGGGGGGGSGGGEGSGGGAPGGSSGGGSGGGGGGGARGAVGGPPGAPGLVGEGPDTFPGGASSEEPTGVGSSVPASGNPTSAGFVGNAAFRTFEFRYEQSYNIVFTIRYNRVVRMYIFGDPDFFNDPRRRIFRTSY